MFQNDINIIPEDIDHMGHVNNAVFIKWAQKIAQDYWLTVATPELFKSRLWIAIEHHIRYLKPALLGDKITGQMRFAEFRPTRVLFDVKIVRDAAEIARVKSWWCFIDAETKRPARLPQLLAFAALERQASPSLSTI